MFAFFRKYERYVMLTVGIVLIIPFVFFGTFGAYLDERDQPKVVEYAINRSPIAERDLQQLVKMLLSEPEETSIFEHLILDRKIAHQIVQAYPTEFKEELEERLSRVKKGFFYTHPRDKETSSQRIWEQVDPHTLTQWHILRSMPDVGENFFAHWVRLYKMQKKCSSEWMRRVLLRQQAEKNLPRDPRLETIDLSVCGYQTAEEWFGSQLCRKIAKLIWNGSILAEKRGITVSIAEAQEDFARRVGVEKNVVHFSAAQVWQKALLFLRCCEREGFSTNPSEELAIDFYQLPIELQLKTAEDLIAFEIYCQKVCSPMSSDGVPLAFESVEKVQQKAPEMLYSSYRAQVKRVDLAELAARLSMKEVWEWQISSAHWDTLRIRFPEIAQATDALERLQALEKLDRLRSEEVQKWSRMQIVQAHPEWIEEQLTQSVVRECLITIPWGGDRVGGLALRNSEDTREKMAMAARNGTLLRLREGDFVFELENVQLEVNGGILSFGEARRLGALLEEFFLQKKYEQMRDKMGPFVRDEAKWKPLADVRDLVVRQWLKTLLQKISKEEQPLSFYAIHRFDKVLEKVVTEGMEKLGLWHLHKQSIGVSEESWLYTIAKGMSLKECSPILISPKGEICFFRVIQQKQERPNLVACYIEEIISAMQKGDR